MTKTGPESAQQINRVARRHIAGGHATLSLPLSGQPEKVN